MKNTFFTLFAIILLAVSLIAFVAIFPLFYSAEYSDILAVSPVTFVLFPLCVAAENGNLLKVKELLDEGAEEVNGKDEYGNTALMLAAYDGHIKVVKELLIKKYGAKVDHENQCSMTALMFAAMQGYSQIVQVLLDNEAKHKSQQGITALMLAAKFGHSEVARILLDHPQNGADVNYKSTDDNSTALIYAAGTGHGEVAKLLLDKDASNVNDENNKGYTALILAAKYGSREGQSKVAKLLLKNGANVHDKSKVGYTALRVAEKVGNGDIVREWCGCKYCKSV